MSISLSLSRGIDYLGALARTLGDLTGYSTLAFELIQNADDAGASRLVFTFSEEGLEVWNDGVFSDCGHQELPPDDCPMRDAEGHRCDFHSFRLVSGEDKRQRDHTIGAFGIGFTAVYQITDRPELISVGRHWIIDETGPESERIKVCDGCTWCDPNPPGTTLLLPWASKGGSALRARLSAPAINEEGVEELRRELVDSLPTAILFLRNLNQLEVHGGDAPTFTIERHANEDMAVVQVNNRLETWLLRRGSFAAEAQTLRAKYGDKIEGSRRAEVTVAFPMDHSIDGRLCAYLPTRESTGLPFHINADFFPASDRTRLPDEGYRGEWNRAAIHAAAELVAGGLTDLRDLLGPRRLWELIQAAWRRRSGDGVGGRDEWLGLFWSELANVLSESPIFHTSAGEWVSCREGVTIRQLDEEAPSIPLLERLGLKIVDPDLHAIVYGLPRVEVLRTTELALSSLVESLRESDFAAPDGVEPPTGMVELAWRELSVLLARPGADPSLLDDISLAPTIPKGLAPFSTVRRADETTRSLFGSIVGETRFLDEERLRSVAGRLVELVGEFETEDAVALLESDDSSVDIEQIPAILGWFSGRAGRVDESLGQRLAALPIFPTTSGPRPLVDLSIPGGFDDQLGLAEVVDSAVIPFALSFLKQLGARELTIQEYARRVVPASTQVAHSDPDRWRRLVELLATEGELRDEPDIRSILSGLPLIETGQSFVSAPTAYFPSEELDRVLVDYAATSPTAHESVTGFYEWLGVARKPRPSDLIARVERLAAGAVTPQAVRNVKAIVTYLAQADESFDAAIQALAREHWLPADGDDSRWYKPDQLAAGYQRYLFETQALFVGLPMSVQRAKGVNDLFESLTVRNAPSPDQVVAHLLECATRGETVNNQVYRFLNDNADHPALDGLTGRPCILTPDGRYLQPEHLFRAPHPFGRFRSVVGAELRGMDSLWERLRIRESPDASDAVGVLVDVSDEFGAANEALDDEALLVVMRAWRLIERALDGSEEIDLGRLEDVKCIPDLRQILLRPDRALFDDAPEYADALQARIGDMLIRKPEGAWRAMARVGVRSLAAGVEVELHEATDEVDDEEVGGLIAERRRQIFRAVDPLLSGSGTTEVLSRLDALSFGRVSRLEVVYRLHLPGSNVDLRSEVLPATTVLVADRILRTSDPVSSVELARELAKRIAPSVERTALVPALALALQPGTPNDADAALDSAGVPRLDSAVEGSVVPAVLEVLGGAELPDDQVTFGVQTDSDTVRPEPDATTAPQSDESQTGAEEPAPPDDSEYESAPSAGEPRAGDGRRTDRRRPPTKGTRRTFLRSYVSPIGDADDQELQDDGGRSETDVAGTTAVLAYERSYGREPTLMPHDNPGFDIESRNPSGEVARYIEVKSLTGEWTDLGAGLSARQYQEGSERRGQFWLYVVEHATSDPQVYPIQDPVGKVDQFMFDDNWKLIAGPRRRALPEIEVLAAGGHEAPEWKFSVPVLEAGRDSVRAWEAGNSLGESVDVAAGEVRFVCRTGDGRLWGVGDPPHDRDRSGRLLLVEFERNGRVESAVGWYRVFTNEGRVAVEITPEPHADEPMMLFPDYEVDVAVLGEVLGRGVVIESRHHRSEDA